MNNLEYWWNPIPDDDDHWVTVVRPLDSPPNNCEWCYISLWKTKDERWKPSRKKDLNSFNYRQMTKQEIIKWKLKSN